jgi:hypothetical protein
VPEATNFLKHLRRNVRCDYIVAVGCDGECGESRARPDVHGNVKMLAIDSHEIFEVD